MVSAISGILYPVHLLKNPNSTPREQSFWTADVLVDSTIWFSFHVLFRLFHLFAVFVFCFIFASFDRTSFQDCLFICFKLILPDFLFLERAISILCYCSIRLVWITIPIINDISDNYLIITGSEVFLKISQNAHENTFAWATFKYSCRPIKKETLTQVFSSEFCETFKGTFF